MSGPLSAERNRVMSTSISKHTISQCNVRVAVNDISATRTRAFLRAASLMAITALAFPQSTFAQASTVSLLGYTAAVPKTWTLRPPTSKMRLAEFVAGVPGGAEVIVYSFGAGQGGTVEANLERWKHQFSNPDGKTVSERVTHGKVGTFPMTVAEYQGTYARGIGAGSAPPDALPNHILIAAIVETPKGSLIFQMFGPKVAAAAERDAYLSFVKSMK